MVIILHFPKFGQSNYYNKEILISGNVHEVEEFLKRGIDVNTKDRKVNHFGMTALHYAAENGELNKHILHSNVITSTQNHRKRIKLLKVRSQSRCLSTTV